MTTTNTASAVQILISLIPVLAGGFLALAGGIGVGLLSHWLKTRTEKANRRIDKHEELLVALFDQKIWLGQVNSHRVFGGEEPQLQSPAAKILAISSVYFPELKSKFAALDSAADQYELAMYNAATERVTAIVLSQASLESVKRAYEPYTSAFHELVRILQEYGVELSSQSTILPKGITRNIFGKKCEASLDK